MQRNQYFEIKIFSCLIVITLLLIWASIVSSNSTQENSDWDEESAYKVRVLQEIDDLCQGEISLPASIQKQLKCRYTDNGNPFLIMAPFKEEEAYLEPRIVIFHDAISDREIETLKWLAQPPIKLVEVNADNENIQFGRTSQIAYLSDVQHEIIGILNRRVEHMTSLSATSADPIQVCYYRTGGLYLPHFDFLPVDEANELEEKNRIATLMYYMNDVEEGGSTVFTELNLSLKPRKGSAVFWYNLTPSGMGDPLTVHAACPVISGTKLVANVWLNELGQELLRPCT